ncbi:EH signature domain-containing protein [Novispirillum sp. DQ9]|uniref:EH signature domain-containing protein n=1 Tax=Novispirillum sp. DQ9 TaxID=3398612 RepID=UPI003C7B57B0
MILDRLKAHMTAVRDALAPETAVFGEPHLMTRATAEIRRRVDGTGGPGRDRMMEALQIVEAEGVVAACGSHLRYLCWALNEPYRGAPGLLERPGEPWRDLLGEVDKALKAETLSLSAWRGLLNAYLNVVLRPREGALLAGWSALRAFLDRTLEAVVRQARFQPAWLSALREHRNILSEQPCDRYAAAVLSGEGADLEVLAGVVGVPEESWLWKDLILAQVDHLCRLADPIYLGSLDHVLALVGSHPALVNDALVTVLTRHHASLADSPHRGLQDFATAHWGSPHLHTQAKWSLVAPQVKQMVREWIVREDLKLFFDILSADGAADQRRLNFWLRYAKQVDYASFALGPAAYKNPSEDYVRIRARKGRISALTSPGSPDNNAFILKIGPFYFVEFGQTGNAAYGYRQDDVPFRLPTTQLSLHDLKNKRRACLWQPHMAEWEPKLTDALAALGVYADDQAPQARRGAAAPRAAFGAPGASTRTGSPADHHETQSATSGGSAPSGRAWDAAALALAKQHGVTVMDQRSKGGCLWILAASEYHPAASDLRKLGFKFTSGRGFWRKDKG